MYAISLSKPSMEITFTFSECFSFEKGHHILFKKSLSTHLNNKLNDFPGPMLGSRPPQLCHVTTRQFVVVLHQYAWCEYSIVLHLLERPLAEETHHHLPSTQAFDELLTRVHLLLFPNESEIEDHILINFVQVILDLYYKYNVPLCMSNSVRNNCCKQWDSEHGSSIQLLHGSSLCLPIGLIWDNTPCKRNNTDNYL